MRPSVAWEHEVARLVALRHAKGLTQEELAQAAGVSSTALGAWEVGARPPRIEHWLRWRDALGLAPPWSTEDERRRAAWRAAVLSRSR